MSNTFQQAVKVRRVSLQLSSEKSKKNDHLAQSRVSLCYSSNLKKRTDALSAQRTGINQFLQKTHSLIKPIPQPVSAKTSSHQPKRKQKNISSSTPSKTPTLIDHKGQIKINIQRIEIKAKSMEIKSKRNINSNNQFSQSQNKNIGNDILDYGTITLSQIIKQKMNTQPVSESQPFTHIRQMIWSAKATKHKKNDKNSSCKNRKIKTVGIQTMAIPCKNLLSSQRINSKKQILKKQIEGKQKQRDKNLSEEIAQKNQFLITEISKKIPCKTIQISKIPLNSNRICTTLSTLGANTQIDTIASNSHSLAHPHTGNKSTYKTSNINLSQHFPLFQQRQRELAREREGLSSGFPLCKRATMSTFNKYYQNIIQEVKNRQFKIKSELQQQAAKAQENYVKQQIADDKKKLEIQDNVKQSLNKNRLYKNFTVNMANFETVKSVSLQKEMARNHSVEGNAKNFTNNADRNKRIKNNSQNQQSNSKLIHSVHNHLAKNQFTNTVTNANNPNISKNIKMYQNHNLMWFEMSNAKVEEENMEQLEINNTICKKKQLLERPMYTEENKKRILKHYGKSLAKKCNTQILHNNFTNQQYLKQMQISGQVSYSRMERPMSKNLDHRKCNKIENKEQSIAGWDVLNMENDAHDENF